MPYKMRIKIVNNVLERIKYMTTPCKGYLFGTVFDNCQYVLGLFVDSENKMTDTHFPANVDMCGVFQVGPLNIDSAHEMLKNVDITDTPVFISVTEVCVVFVYHYLNFMLELAPIMMLPDKEIYLELRHFRMKAQIPFRSELNCESIMDEMLRIRKQFSAGKIAFNCPDHNVFWLGSEQDQVSGPNVEEDITIRKLFGSSSLDEQDYSQTSDDAIDLNIVPITMYRKTTLDVTQVEQTHAPIIQIDKCEIVTIEMCLQLDAISVVHNDLEVTKLYTILVESACRNIRLMCDYMVDYLKASDNMLPRNFNPEVLHFFPSKCGHFVSRVMDKSEMDTDDEETRRELHSNFLLAKNRPYFRRSNKYSFRLGNTRSITDHRNNRLSEPHKKLKDTQSDGERALVSGKYEYYHYSQDNMDDDGWGCAYRSLQTLVSWFKLQGFVEKPVPTFKEIQQCLFDIGDKPASFVDSRQWIGSTEVGFVLDTLFGITSKILYVSSGEDMGTNGPELVYHFQTQGSPIMIGGGVLAHTILGVDYNRNTGDIKYLILDPHYKGGEDIKTIINKGWCGWKDANFWDKKSYYNMCMPKVPDNV